MVLEKVEIPATMRAVHMYKCGKPEVLQLESGVPLPKCGKSQVGSSTPYLICNLAMQITHLIPVLMVNFNDQGGIFNWQLAAW